MIGFCWVWQPGCGVQWEAVAAITTGIAAAATWWAASSARMAAKTALDIDQRSTERAQLREQREAGATAAAIRQEMLNLADVARSLKELLRECSVEMRHLAVSSHAPQFTTDVTNRLFEKLGHFDIQTSNAIALASYYAGFARQWADEKPTNVADRVDFIRSVRDRIIDSVEEWARTAAVCLAKYVPLEPSNDGG